MTQFATSIIQVAMDADALETTRPMSRDAESPEQIEAQYDSIVYEKGEANSKLTSLTCVFYYVNIYFSWICHPYGCTLPRRFYIQTGDSIVYLQLVILKQKINIFLLFKI